MGEIPTEVNLHDHIGGKVNGSPFNTKEIKGKVYLVTYVDPDHKELNSDFFELIREKKFDRSQYNSIAIINFEATWLPDFAISASLKSKQKKFPHTIYVEDKEKILVDQWGLADETMDILLFDREGKLLFHQHGELSAQDRAKVLTMIEDRVE
jgi:predicted transcriptional regulator